MGFFTGLVVGVAGSVIVMFFVYKNNKAKFKKAVDIALDTADKAEKKMKEMEEKISIISGKKK